MRDSSALEGGPQNDSPLGAPFRQGRGPVEDDSDGRSKFQWNGQQEALAIAGDGELIYRWAHGDARLEKALGDAGRQGNSSRDRHGHHGSIESQVEEFPAVFTPARLRAAIGREAQLLAWRLEGLDVHLPPSRLIRHVGKPASLRRNLRLIELERACRESASASDPRTQARAKFLFPPLANGKQ